LFNLEEIKFRIREMRYLDAVLVYGSGMVPDGDVDPSGKTIIKVTQADRIVGSVQVAILSLDRSLYDIYVDRYNCRMRYKEIANFEGINVRTVKRRITRIRETVQDRWDRDDLELDEIMILRNKLYGITDKGNQAA
jgi:DNA-directed RNA polymerase specialized sigma24 family protein